MHFTSLAIRKQNELLTHKWPRFWSLYDGLDYRTLNLSIGKNCENLLSNEPNVRFSIIAKVHWDELYSLVRVDIGVYDGAMRQRKNLSKNETHIAVDTGEKICVWNSESVNTLSLYVHRHNSLREMQTQIKNKTPEEKKRFLLNKDFFLLLLLLLTR